MVLGLVAQWFCYNMAHACLPPFLGRDYDIAITPSLDYTVTYKSRGQVNGIKHDISTHGVLFWDDLLIISCDIVPSWCYVDLVIFLPVDRSLVWVHSWLQYLSSSLFLYSYFV